MEWGTDLLSAVLGEEESSFFDGLETYTPSQGISQMLSRAPSTAASPTLATGSLSHRPHPQPPSYPTTSSSDKPVPVQRKTEPDPEPVDPMNPLAVPGDPSAEGSEGAEDHATPESLGSYLTATSGVTSASYTTLASTAATLASAQYATSCESSTPTTTQCLCSARIRHLRAQRKARVQVATLVVACVFAYMASCEALRVPVEYRDLRMEHK